MSSCVGTTQFINQKLLEEHPIFSKTRVDFTPKHPLTHLVVANNNIVMALANKTLIRIDRSGGSGGGRQEEIDLTKTVQGGKISSLFLDPTGSHLLIACKPTDVEGSPELYYLPKCWTKPRPCAKFKGTLVTSVGWNYSNKEKNSTGTILAGSALGIIMETELSSDDTFFSQSIERLYRQVFDIGKGQHTPVTGLQVQAVPNTTKYMVMATTNTRLYQFQGYVNSSSDRPLLQQVFNNYLNVQERFLELPSTLRYSNLSLYFGQNQNSGPMFAKQFGWFTESGIYFGRIDPWDSDGDTVTVDCRLLPTQDTSQELLAKTAFITEFHALVLYKDRVKGVCLLNEQFVFDDDHDGTYGKLVGLAHDQMKNIFWVFTEYAVYKYEVCNEARHVWKIYLEQGQYNLAMRHCGENTEAMDLILTRQAEQLYSEERWVESAMHYAKTKSSFEEVTLKFMNLKEKNALKNYLKKKLETLKNSEQTQITLIVIWLLEIYQNQLGVLRESSEDREELSSLEEEFFSLLRQQRVEDCIRNNKDVVYNLLGSHGDQRSLIYLAQSLRDLERVLQYNLRNNKYQEVLSILSETGDTDLIYSYLGELLLHCPQHSVDTIIKAGRAVSPVKVLPAMLGSQENVEVARQCVRYLEFAVSKLGCRDQSVHNLLLSLYIRHSPEKVLEYLDTSPEPYCDTKYGLKQCLERGLCREAVHLYTVLGQHERAVELALTLDVNLAAECAAGRKARSRLEEDLSRKLWLMVARHVVQEKNDIKQAMEFLKECPSVKIEDILPFFPDFVTIDHFKDAICSSLQDYSDHIQSLKQEMKEASASAGVIRDEIVTAKSDHHFVRSTDRCVLCSDLLLSKPFYVFSCGHRFHSDCLAEAVQPHLQPSRQKKLHELQSQLEVLSRETDNTSLDSKSALPSKLDLVQAEMDDLIAAECLFCGDIMIRNIDKPFIEDADFQRVINEWL